MTLIRIQTLIAAPPEVCFDLAREIDLHVASHAASGESAVGGRTSGLIGPGETVTWRARHLGRWRALTAQMTAFDRPRHFQDRMIEGPFRAWIHDHHFRPVEGGTVMTDEVEFSAPFGPLGRLVERLYLTGYLRDLLEHHHRHLRAEAERRTAAARGAPPPWPLYPFTVQWNDEEPEVLADELEVATGLEFFDSEDPEDPTAVVDSLGRRIRLQVEACSITDCELK
jgi:hypothetical protein